MSIEYKFLGITGEKIPSIGLGTWGLGGYSRSSSANDEKEIELIRYAAEKGLTFIDTAEMYGAGHAEELVGQAVKDIRSKVFIATKVSPEHLRYDDVIKACERSLKRLQTSYIDLYQIHWPNPRVPLRETIKALERLAEEGKIRYIGVSNFSVELLKEAISLTSKHDIVSNQVEYSLLSREIEKDLLDFAKNNKITIIAYSPLARGAIFSGEYAEKLRKICEKYNKTISQVALNWLISKENVVAIPKTSKKERIDEFLGAYGWRLSKEDVEEIERIFS
ncbi:MAG: aldo/keto reductase [Thermoproteota archaeon]|jgi:Aldo/keto reductases, related to diketogulonate reductase